MRAHQPIHQPPRRPTRRLTRRPLAPRLVAATRNRVDNALRDEVARAAGLPFNYAERGAAATAGIPHGYRRIARAVTVGHGVGPFVALATAIPQWRIQADAGLRVEATEPAKDGVDVALATAIGPLAVVLACRVVWTIDEARRAGFGYGTLRGHPEAGEEGFVVEHHPDDTVTFSVIGFTSPGTWLTTVTAPLADLLRRRTVRGYLRAAREIAATADT